MLICIDGCGDNTKPLVQYGGCNIKTRQFGYSHFVLVACTYQFADILDATELETAVASDDVHISPVGILNIQVPSSTSFVATGCGVEIQGTLEYPATFETYQTDVDLADFTYWVNFFNNSASWSIIPITCDGIFHVTPEYAAATASPPATVLDQTPGYQFSVTQAPVWTQGEGKNGKWSVGLKIITNQPFPGIYLPGVVEVLQ